MPEHFKYGYVVGTLVHSLGDGSDDDDRLPDVVPAQGVAVTFTRDQRQAATTAPPRLVSYAPVKARVLPSGEITSDLEEPDSTATPGVWLVTGTYRVSTSGHYPEFNIVVTEDHTQETPLDLALAVGYTPPTGVTVQTVQLPSGAATGQVLGWTATGAAWVLPEAPEAPVTSVNGQIGDVVLDIPDVSDVSGTGMPNGVVTADPGTYYTDTAGTNGAWRWLKKSGTGNTGWEVVHGDTGWRDVSGDLLNDWEGSLLIRRVGNIVYLGSGGYGVWQDTPGDVTMLNMPTGWWTSSAVVELPSPPGTECKIWGLTDQMIQSDAHTQWFPSGSYVTDDAWPDTLPGTSA